MNNFNEPGPINVGVGEDISILELANTVKEIVGFKGEIVHDLTKPDGTPRKLMDVSKLTSLGCTAKIALKAGIQAVYESLIHKEWY